ncbi:MAG: hypothetical protein WCJ58_01020 [bacterium]|jgi:hypothetical protein
MDLDSLYKLAGIAAFIIAGVNFVIAIVGKTFWNLTFKRLEQEVAVLKEAEHKNSIVRHDFTNVTNSVYAKMDKLETTLTNAIDMGFTHVKELFGKEVDNIHRRFDEKK